MLTSLCHPVVWGAYATLGVRDRDLVLDGSPDGTGRLAAVVIDRFLRKCSARRQGAWLDHHLADALRAVARLSSAAVAPHSRAGVWDAGCSGILTRDEPAALYGEALTYGLIQEEAASSWRWGHAFLSDALARGDA